LDATLAQQVHYLLVTAAAWNLDGNETADARVKEMRMEPDTPLPDQPIFNIARNTVALGPHRRDLVPLYQKWYNDFSVMMPYLLQLRPRTREAQEAGFVGMSSPEPPSVHFTIYESATLRPIGVTFLDNIDTLYQLAEFNIFIGERDCWGKGYGTETTVLMLDYGFTLLGLHNITLRVDGYNERAIRAYTRAGFKEFGRRREVRRRGERRYDVVYMDCLASEFTQSTLSALLPH
jgi:diamine N-acetyltransferase